MWEERKRGKGKVGGHKERERNVGGEKGEEKGRQKKRERKCGRIEREGKGKKEHRRR